MSRGTYVLRDGELVPKHLAPPLTPRGPRSGLPRPFVVSDCMEIVSQADGRTYTSKAKYRAELRALGMTEVGNDSSIEPENIRAKDPLADMTPVEHDIKQAIAEVASR